MPKSGRASRRLAVAGSLALAVTLLVGCAPTASDPTPTATAAPTPTPTPTPTPDPELVEGGTAGQNRPYFEFVLGGVLEATSQPTSQQLMTALVDAGFAREAIEITADRTRVNDPADSILISILIDGQCLLGQVIEGDLVTDLADVLGTGRCLVGRAASLD